MRLPDHQNTDTDDFEITIAANLVVVNYDDVGFPSGTRYLRCIILVPVTKSSRLNVRICADNNYDSVYLVPQTSRLLLNSMSTNSLKRNCTQESTWCVKKYKHKHAHTHRNKLRIAKIKWLSSKLTSSSSKLSYITDSLLLLARTKLKPVSVRCIDRGRKISQRRREAKKSRKIMARRRETTRRRERERELKRLNSRNFAQMHTLEY